MYVFLIDGCYKSFRLSLSLSLSQDIFFLAVVTGIAETDEFLLLVRGNFRRSEKPSCRSFVLPISAHIDSERQLAEMRNKLITFLFFRE